MPEVPLTHRERVKMALAHESPDHVPMDFGAEPEVWQRLQEHFGTDNREEILQILNIDFRVVSFDYEIFCRPPHDPSPPSEPGCSAWKIAAPDGITTDVWGAHRKPCKTEFGIYYELCNFPLAKTRMVGFWSIK
jgi:hypothetical protein